MPATNRFQLTVPADISDIFPDFLQNRRNEVAAIPAALEQGNYEQIRIWGHNMAGCGEGYGFPAITEFGRILEAAALSRDPARVKSCQETLDHLVNDVDVVYE